MGKGVLAGVMWRPGRGRSRAMRMTWCRARLGDNEANKKEMQMKRAASEEPGTGAAAGGRLRQWGAWGGQGGLPASNFPSVKCSRSHTRDMRREMPPSWGTQKTPQGELTLAQHTSVWPFSCHPSSSFPEPAPSLPADPFLFFLSHLFPLPAFRPLLISPAPLHLPQSELFFPLATL